MLSTSNTFMWVIVDSIKFINLYGQHDPKDIVQAELGQELYQAQASSWIEPNSPHFNNSTSYWF